MSNWKAFQSQHFPGTLGAEFFDHMVGDMLGEGASRTVFEYTPDKSCVIKFATHRGSFQNVHEWDVWQQHSAGKGTSVLKFLAPCVSISHSGNILIQKRTQPVPFSWKLPKTIPNILCCDMKRDNWGIFKGRLVCHDYGRHDAVYYASQGRNMDKAVWIGAQNGKFKPLFGEEGATGLVI